ncbi:MAG: isoprenylcysteine carboxylmethyltransferase family protein [Candidatus Thorarchaeota archaeon]
MASHQGLHTSGIRYIVRIHLLLLIQAIVFFTAAGNLSVPRAWLFFGMGVVYYPLSTAIVYWKNPDLINQRGKSEQDTEPWDRILAPLYFLIGYFLMAAVTGLDVGRFTWTYLPPHYILPGVILYVAGGVLNTWAMIANPHFESMVRIQKERGHAVITTGPYRYVRHPGYCAGIIWTLSIPLIMGSVLGFIPGIIGIIVLLVRTSLEDQTLQRELPGYTEYAKKVTGRILPCIW